MPFVVVDTNNLMKDYQLAEGVMQAFLLGCRKCNIGIFFPDVVVDELIGNYERDVNKAATQLISTGKKLERMGAVIEVPIIDTKGIVDAYRKHLQSIFVAYDIGRIEYPNTSPQQLVQASYSGRKPFKDSGDGFKDYLICQSLAALSTREGGLGYLITANKKDFGGADGQLHPDLATSILKGHDIKVFEDVQNFNDAVLGKALEVLESVASSIKKGEFKGFDLEDGLTNLFIEQLCERYHPLKKTGLGLDEPTVDAVGTATVNDLEVSRLDDENLLFELSGVVLLELTGFIDKRDFYTLEDRDLHVLDPDWNDHVLRAGITKEMHFKMTVVFNLDEHKPESVTVEIEPSDDRDTLGY